MIQSIPLIPQIEYPSEDFPKSKSPASSNKEQHDNHNVDQQGVVICPIFHGWRRLNPKTHGVKQNSSRSKMTYTDRQTNLTIIGERQQGSSPQEQT